MKYMPRIWPRLSNLLVVLMILIGCGEPVSTANDEMGPIERPVTLIPLDGPIATRQAELSGMAWYGNTLILLPQYPDRFGEGDGILFAIPKQAILDFLVGTSNRPIIPTSVRFSAPGIKHSIKHFEGYEAIAFSGRNVYLTIESGKNNRMMGYLVGGEISENGDEIRLDASHLVPIQPEVPLDNRTDEALVVIGDQLFTFFEVNGRALNPHPIVHVFGLDLVPHGTNSFPQLEYLVSDATLGFDGKIWILNTFSPKDEDIPMDRLDPLVEKYGSGPTHKQHAWLERLVPLQESETGIGSINLAPIQLELVSEARNWEGLAVLDQRGFLLVTDKSPETLLGFVAIQ